MKEGPSGQAGAFKETSQSRDQGALDAPDTIPRHKSGKALPVARVEATRLRSGGLHSLIKFEVCGQCQDTASGFVGPVPTYRLDWIVVSYSRVAIGTLIDRC